MRKWLKRIALAVSALLLLAAVGAAWIVWRATHVPAWYAAAIDCPTGPAHEAEHEQLIGLQNWLARSGAGNPNQLPEEQRHYQITLSIEEINALLAKWTDNLHGEIETLRVDLGNDELTVQGLWTARGRVVGVKLKCNPAADGRPAVWVDSVRVGEQGVPITWANSKPLARLRGMLADLAGSTRPIDIDEHGIATPRTARTYSMAALQSMAEGKAVEPIAFLSPRLSIEDTIPLNITAIHSASGTLSITFQLLRPDEQRALLDHVNSVLAAAK